MVVDKTSDVREEWWKKVKESQDLVYATAKLRARIHWYVDNCSVTDICNITLKRASLYASLPPINHHLCMCFLLYVWLSPLLFLCIRVTRDVRTHTSQSSRTLAPWAWWMIFIVSGKQEQKLLSKGRQFSCQSDSPAEVTGGSYHRSSSGREVANPVFSWCLKWKTNKIKHQQIDPSASPAPVDGSAKSHEILCHTHTHKTNRSLEILFVPTK